MTVEDISRAIAPFSAWADRFNPKKNNRIPEDDPILDDFALSDTLVPDGLTVGDLRRLKLAFNSLASI